ncbi:MAG: envelope biogenesis factor ElyC [Aliiglaciecola sp.]
MDFFLLKKFIGVFVMPIPIILVLMIVGLFFLFRQNYVKAKWSISFATLGLVVVSFSPLPNHLLYSLEREYPQYDLSKPVDYIVVLGCQHVNDRALPITSQLSPCSSVRAAEAIRILQFNPQAKIITSGHVGNQTFSNAHMTKQFITAMGVDSNRIIAVELSRDTGEEAQNLRKMLNGKPFALVTQATHMKRAVFLFEQAGLSPIAAPTHHFVRESDNPTLGAFFPDSQNIKKFERWWYEWLGNTYVWITSLFA